MAMISMTSMMMTTLALAFALSACTKPAPEAAPTPVPVPVVTPGPTPAHGDDASAALPAGHPSIGASAATTPTAPQNPREVTPSGETRREVIGGFALTLPSEWTARPPKSAMRLAEFLIPGPGGDTELALYRFPGGAGGVEANVSRWKGQFNPPKDKSIDEVTIVDVQERPPLKITRVDITGTNVAEAMPGAGDHRNDPDSRMLAAIIEGSGDPFFLKAAGPRATLDVWAPAFTAVLESVMPAN